MEPTSTKAPGQPPAATLSLRGLWAATAGGELSHPAQQQQLKQLLDAVVQLQTTVTGLSNRLAVVATFVEAERHALLHRIDHLEQRCREDAAANRAAEAPPERRERTPSRDRDSVLEEHDFFLVEGVYPFNK